MPDRLSPVPHWRHFSPPQSGLLLNQRRVGLCWRFPNVTTGSPKWIRKPCRSSRAFPLVPTPRGDCVFRCEDDLCLDLRWWWPLPCAFRYRPGRAENAARYWRKSKLGWILPLMRTAIVRSLVLALMSICLTRKDSQSVRAGQT